MVRIMRAGRVTGVASFPHHAPGYSSHAEPAGGATAVPRPLHESPRGRLAGFLAWLRG